MLMPPQLLRSRVRHVLHERRDVFAAWRVQQRGGLLCVRHGLLWHGLCDVCGGGHGVDVDLVVDHRDNGRCRRPDQRAQPACSCWCGVVGHSHRGSRLQYLVAPHSHDDVHNHRDHWGCARPQARRHDLRRAHHHPPQLRHQRRHRLHTDIRGHQLEPHLPRLGGCSGRQLRRGAGLCAGPPHPLFHLQCGPLHPHRQPQRRRRRRRWARRHGHRRYRGRQLGVRGARHRVGNHGLSPIPRHQAAQPRQPVPCHLHHHQETSAPRHPDWCRTNGDEHPPTARHVLVAFQLAAVTSQRPQAATHEHNRDDDVANARACERQHHDGATWHGNPEPGPRYSHGPHPAPPRHPTPTPKRTPAWWIELHRLSAGVARWVAPTFTAGLRSGRLCFWVETRVCLGLVR
mmetsp:Transcript_3429/g.7367  ORF Transcript_3429/g.7367 Transcript_3429/m.7367 type:complete len:401 (-) Transcript_3429:1067-2269(-)